MYYESVLIVFCIILLWEVIKFGYLRIYQPKPVNVFRDYIYCDANSTTPMLDEAKQAWINAADLGNASTDYATRLHVIPFVLTSGDAIVQNWLNAPKHKVVWNSGASEGNCYCIRSVADIAWGFTPHIISTTIEHKTSIKCLDQLVDQKRITVTYIKPNIYGVIDPIEIAEAVTPHTRLITVIHTNNETGSINNVNEIGKIAKLYNILFHTDAAQSFGKGGIDCTRDCIDLLTASMHKLQGPLGVGLLVMSSRFLQHTKQAQITGTQNNGLRGGTENIPGIAASIVAMQHTFIDRKSKNLKLTQHKFRVVRALDQEFGMLPYSNFAGCDDSLIPYLTNPVENPQIRIVILGEIDTKTGYPSLTTSPSTLLISIIRTGRYDMVNRFCNIQLKQALFERGVIISIGSACNTSAAGPSHVLTNIGAPYVIRSGTIRLSFGDFLSDADVTKLINILIECIKLQI